MPNLPPSGPDHYRRPAAGTTLPRGLRVLAQCGPGRRAAKVSTANLIYSDNPQYSAQPIAASSSPASPDVSTLHLQAVLVK